MGSGKLICPECLKEEVPLELCIDAAEEDDVLEGSLTCPACQRTYPIQNGVAVVAGGFQRWCV
ncbi:MAG: Trm112 family protein [Desulfobacterales bacterium]